MALKERFCGEWIDIETGFGDSVSRKAMGQRPQFWRSGDDERLWLSALIDTMERVSRRDVRAVPCDRRLLAAVKVQLARPAAPSNRQPPNRQEWRRSDSQPGNQVMIPIRSASAQNVSEPESSPAG
ncbi:MAG TPA: hypothetical protein VHB49_12960 [Bradyrhizobium sp.]|nr:hypothetical protein [Bradyrhizobium sp.]